MAAQIYTGYADEDRPGAYVVFAGVGHSWEAEDDSTILGVRWPSVAGY